MAALSDASCPRQEAARRTGCTEIPTSCRLEPGTGRSAFGPTRRRERLYRYLVVDRLVVSVADAVQPSVARGVAGVEALIREAAVLLPIAGRWGIELGGETSAASVPIKPWPGSHGCRTIRHRSPRSSWPSQE